MIDIIVRETNRKAQQIYERERVTNSAKLASMHTWKTLTTSEFEAYLGILLLAGVMRSNYVHSTELWKTSSHPIFRATMSIQQFRSSFIRFDDGRTRELYPYRGGTGLTQYIPSKPAKYGIKVWCSHIIPHQRPNIYRVSIIWTNGKTPSLGTVNKRRTFLPPMFANPHGREIQSTLYGFSENISICSYIPKKNKSVVMLSTMHYDKDVQGPKEKPAMIIDYNKFKGGVDNMDKCLSEYSTKRKTNR
uniref:PiggyBac transposable element-derived protein domain-containing protein n=1 Tax=Anopheles quadriannulatus TaxID=34691 RepID=A0A182XQ41_ANOQN